MCATGPGVNAPALTARSGMAQPQYPAGAVISQIMITWTQGCSWAWGIRGRGALGGTVGFGRRNHSQGSGRHIRAGTVELRLKVLAGLTSPRAAATFVPVPA